MKLFPQAPPPGPFRRDAWRSPLRGPWLTSVLGAALLAGIPIVFVTGLLSYVAYEPALGRNNLIGDPGFLDFFLFSWPTSPVWLYALTQGLHVTVGIALVPIVLVKLWSAMPKLFEWPPVRSPAHALERASLALLVSSTLFQFATGILNAQLYYPWKFSFLSAHYYGAWVFIAAFVAHAALKVPTMRRSLRERRLLGELRRGLDETTPETGDSGLIAAAPSAPTISRRGVLAVTGGASLGLLTLTAGQSVGGPLREIAFLAPHGRDLGDGPNDFQVNKTARSLGITPAQTGEHWRLRVVGGTRRIELSRADLLALAQQTYELPIACVEGWSTTQTWSGVRLRDLAALAGVASFDELLVESIQAAGSFRRASLSPRQAGDRRSLLALRVNGADLSPDHGFPARIIVPALPGVHCTKWVNRLEFQGHAGVKIGRAYGAGPLHLLSTVAALALAAYAFTRIFAGGQPWNVVLWFVGAVVLHDLIAFPLYTALNRLALGRRTRAVNHIRVPMLLSGCALIVFFPLILGLGAGRYESSTTLSQDVYLGRWLLLCGAMFAVSALLYAMRARHE